MRTMKSRLLASVSALALITGATACDDDNVSNNTVIVEEEPADTALALNDQARIDNAANSLDNEANPE